jgi:hypothetical protein
MNTCYLTRMTLTLSSLSRVDSISSPKTQLSACSNSQGLFKSTERWQDQILFHVRYRCMCPNLLDAADAESPLKESELQVLRSQYLKELEAQHITVQTKFNYAWGLIKSEQHENQLEGVKLLTGISHYLHFASTISLELMLI